MAAYDTETNTKYETKLVKRLLVIETLPEKYPSGKRIIKEKGKFDVEQGAAGKSGCKKRDCACAKAIVADASGEESKPWQN